MRYVLVFLFDLFALPAFTMLSWNFVMPPVTGAGRIDYWKAMVLILGVQMVIGPGAFVAEQNRQRHEEVVNAIKEQTFSSL